MFLRRAAMRLMPQVISRRCHLISRSVLNALPHSYNAETTWEHVIEAVRENGRTIVVLDDDPTGSQTAYNTNVLMKYDVPTLVEQLRLNQPLFYILTNTRSMAPEDARKTLSTILRNLRAANGAFFANRIQLVSRCDSTLRGHFPLEIDTIYDYYNNSYDGLLFIPAFFDAGRVTIDDTHYIMEEKYLVPVSKTMYAKDPHFGFRTSQLQKYIQEKSNHRISKEQIKSISINEIREGVDTILDILGTLESGDVCIVNAVNENDMNALVIALLQAEARGQHFLYRTAASFIASRAGLFPRDLLKHHDIFPLSNPAPDAGGLFVIGSYIQLSTLQLNALRGQMDVECIEFDVVKYLQLDQSGIDTMIAHYIDKISKLILNQRHVVIFTTRALTSTSSIDDHSGISIALAKIVSGLHTLPAFVVAKGGNTSYAIAADGMKYNVATVLGQIIKGVSVWRNAETVGPSVPFVVFPGNVGDATSLVKVAEVLGVKRNNNVELLSTSTHNSVATSTTGNVSVSDLYVSPDDLLPVPKVHKAYRGRTLSLLEEATSRKEAIAAFNVYNMEGAKAVVDAAEECEAPVILQMHSKVLQFGGKPLLAMLRAFRQHACVPVCLHLDHCESEGELYRGLHAGLDSVMVDGSSRSFEDNMRWTAAMTMLAHEEGIPVEAELGRLTGSEDGLEVEEREAKMTDPENVSHFLNYTKADMLAVTIGNVHGHYSRPPSLDFDRLAAIRAKAPHTPLVLHGASGLPRELIEGAVAGGVVKFNVNTELREAAVTAIQDTAMHYGLRDKVELMHMMQASHKAMMGVAMAKIRLFKHVMQTKNKGY